MDWGINFGDKTLPVIVVGFLGFGVATGAVSVGYLFGAILKGMVERKREGQQEE